jgi:hypothetical protein
LAICAALNKKRQNRKSTTGHRILILSKPAIPKSANNGVFSKDRAIEAEEPTEYSYSNKPPIDMANIKNVHT